MIYDIYCDVSPSARIQNDGPWPPHLGDHDNIGPVRIHGVDATVGRIGPVYFLGHPVIGHPIRVDARVQDGFEFLVFRHQRYFCLRSNLGDHHLLILVVEVDSNHVYQPVDGFEGDRCALGG